MNKKTLNCILFLILSIIISSPAFASPVDDIVGYWESKKLERILTITPNSITQNNLAPMPFVAKAQDEKIILSTAWTRAIVKIIDKNKLEMKIGHRKNPDIYTRIDEATAKKILQEYSKLKKR